MSARHEARRALANSAVSIVLLIAIALLANVIATRHLFSRFDLTEDRENTLAPGTLATLQSLPDRARVRVFVTKDLPPEAAPYLQPPLDVLDRIERSSQGRVQVEYLDPAESTVAEEAKKLGITPISMQIMRRDRAERVPISFGVDIRCGEKNTRTIPFLDTRNPEYELARALKAVSDPAPRVVGFLTGEPPEPPKFEGFEMPMPPDRVFQRFRESLRDRFQLVDVADTKQGNPVPDEVQVLVVRPKGLDERQLFEIDQFLMRGGRLLVMQDRHAYTPSGSHDAVATGMDPLLEKWGLQIPDDVLVVDMASRAKVQVPQKGPRGERMMVIADYAYFPALTRQTGGFSDKHPVTKSLQQLVLGWASPIDVLPARPSSLEIENLLSSSEFAFRTKEVDQIAPDMRGVDARVMAKATSKSYARERLAVSLVGKFPSLFAGKPVPPATESRPSNAPPPKVPDDGRAVRAESAETRVIVVADTDLAQNMQWNEESAIFLGNAIDWLALDQDLISIRSRGQTRWLRDLDVDAMKAKGLGGEKVPETLEEAAALKEKYDKVGLEARDVADAQRSRIRAANLVGPAVALLGIAGWRWWRRRRERERLARPA
ncbi:MAG TPA: GldG family protein [Planctomycetota bacterium]|nr:GldG family protein [Planctomycetota bacterium]